MHIGSDGTTPWVRAIFSILRPRHKIPMCGTISDSDRNVITRGGSNQFHGDAYWFGRYNALGARDFFNPAPAPQNPYVRNDFGFSIGGPIIKNRTFFFINNEYQQIG